MDSLKSWRIKRVRMVIIKVRRVHRVAGSGPRRVGDVVDVVCVDDLVGVVFTLDEEEAVVVSEARTRRI